MFFLKKILSRCFFPVPLSLEFLIVGLYLLWFSRRQRAGKVLVTGGAMLLLCLSNSFVASALLRPLEHDYPVFEPVRASAIVSGAPFIVVLGGFGDHDPEVPVTSHIGPNQMVRLIEGVYLQRELPGGKLILSGSPDCAHAMTTLAEALGVGAENIRQLADPKDTEAESRQVASIVGAQPFILVTSAAHMPRAMMLFRRRGLQPIPAPTDYLAPRHRLESDDFFPEGYHLYMTQVVFYEYLGRAWETLRGR